MVIELLSNTRERTRVDNAVGETQFRVFRDPAGHTFCLVWGVGD